MTKWSEHVKKYAKKYKMSYRDASMDSKCKESYQKMSKKRMSSRKVSKKRMSPRKVSKKRMISPSEESGIGTKGIVPPGTGYFKWKNLTTGEEIEDIDNLSIGDEVEIIHYFFDGESTAVLHEYKNYGRSVKYKTGTKFKIIGQGLGGTAIERIE